MKIFNIAVAGRVAHYSLREGHLICDNSDYSITFSFDAEWHEHPEKTARFIWNGMYYDQKFTGTECPVPVIHGAKEVKVGVYAGDLWTTTPAVIPCRGSILDEDGSTAQPEQVEEFRDQAALSAARAEAGAERAAEEASVAAEAKFNELIDGAIVQEPGTDSNKVMSQAATTEAIGAAGLKGSASGETVTVNDVTPVRHPLGVRVHGKNLLHFVDTSKSITNTDGLNLIGTVSEGSVSFEGVFNGGGPKAKVFRMDMTSPSVNYINYEIIKESLAIKLHRGIYVFTANESASIDISNLCGGYLLVGELGGTETNGRATKYRNGAVIKVDRDDYYAQFVLYVYQDNPVENFTYSARPQLEEGDTATEYEPYLDPTTVTLTRYGADETDHPETYTPNEDGTVDGVTSLAPVMTLLTDTEGVTVEVEYTRDPNAALDEVKADIEELDRVTAELAAGGDIAVPYAHIIHIPRYQNTGSYQYSDKYAVPTPAGCITTFTVPPVNNGSVEIVYTYGDGMEGIIESTIAAGLQFVIDRKTVEGCTLLSYGGGTTRFDDTDMYWSAFYSIDLRVYTNANATSDEQIVLVTIYP